MTSAQSWSRRHHLAWADVIHADFHRVISRYIQNNSTCLSSKSQRGIRTTAIQKSKLKYAYLPSKIVAIWIDRFCVRYDWWRRLQPTSSVFPVCERGRTFLTDLFFRIILTHRFFNNDIYRIHRSAIWIGFVLVRFIRYTGLFRAVNCNIACKGFPMHCHDQSPIIKPLYVVMMCRIFL